MMASFAFEKDTADLHAQNFYGIYPEKMFAALASLTKEHKFALDVATGNGQAAEQLAKFYKTVLATDPSAGQLANAVPAAPNVHYKCLPAELSDEQLEAAGLEESSVDLITVAGSIHYIDLEKFHPLVQKLLKPGGIYAVWGDDPWFDDPKLNELYQCYCDILRECVPRPWQIWDSKYLEIPFPFKEISHFPDGRTTKGYVFESVKQYNLNGFIGFLSGWGTAQKYKEDHGVLPIEKIRAQLTEAWGNPLDLRACRFCIFMRIGQM